MLSKLFFIVLAGVATFTAIMEGARGYDNQNRETEKFSVRGRYRRPCLKCGGYTPEGCEALCHKNGFEEPSCNYPQKCYCNCANVIPDD
ncbi:unnamed protein product [Allacma fusca]|uniref:Uncharacterized protein n=1 Tax=Allacma fusca TaxID=39272 RepID=A0A8J2PMA6_9HEXA|nr:unnamed protein product [Allacma fusca]